MNTDKDILELIQKLKAGNQTVFEELSERYRAVVDSSAKFALASMERSGLPVGSETEEDLRQDGRFALYRAALSYDADGMGQGVTFGLYAKICIRNAMISELRRMSAAKRRTDRLISKSHEYSESSAGDNTSALLQKLLVEDVLRRGLPLLSGYEKKVLLSYAAGRSVTEIAEELGKPQKSVSNALYRIKVKLKDIKQT